MDGQGTREGDANKSRRRRASDKASKPGAAAAAEEEREISFAVSELLRMEPLPRPPLPSSISSSSSFSPSSSSISSSSSFSPSSSSSTETAERDAISSGDGPEGGQPGTGGRRHTDARTITCEATGRRRRRSLL
eukprot:738211-Hanusia_phi.AAC.4